MRDSLAGTAGIAVGLSAVKQATAEDKAAEISRAERVGHTLDLECRVTPSGLGGSYGWSKEIGPGTMTFSPDAFVQDPNISADERGVYRAKVQYTISDLTLMDNTENIYVVEVELFRDSYYQKPLRDWPAEGGLLRSPKYLFRKNEAVYVRVSQYAPDSDTREFYEEAVKVTSDAHSDVVYLDLKEGAADNYVICTSSWADDELLFLRDLTDDDADADDKIEVKDEDVLTFYLEVPPQSGTYVESNSVMVDRAEVAAVDGTETLDANEFIDEWVDHDVCSVALYDKDHDKLLGTGAKCVELGNEADMLYVAGHCAHGTTNIVGVAGYGLASDSFQPSDVGTWDEELEWLVLACCSTMEIDPSTLTGPGTDWVDTMGGSARGHAIMGYRDGAPGGSTQTKDTDIANNFVYQSTVVNRTVKSAWMWANFGYKDADPLSPGHPSSPLNAVAITKDDNALDKIDTWLVLHNLITRDSTDDDWTYWWIDWEWDDLDPDHVKDNPAP